ncbi:S1C family serine protease [Corynebacterium sp. 335C]
MTDFGRGGVDGSSGPMGRGDSPGGGAGGFGQGPGGPGHGGAQQYGAQQYGASQYGAPQAPQQGYGAAGQAPYGAPAGPVGATGAQGADGAHDPGHPAGDGSGGKSRGKGLGALAVAALMVASAAVGGVAGGLVANNADGGSSSGAIGSGQSVTDAEPAPPAPEGTIERAAQKALPSVVSIAVETPTKGATGSGSILSPDGLVLTNYHVVADAEDPQAKVEVRLNDGTVHPARFIAGHAQSDIAVIQMEGVQGLQPIGLGDSDQLRIGQEVVAVGSPLGLTSTVTSGIVSAMNRPVSAQQGGGEASVIDAVQTDAAINPGNSGGALVDLEGNLVGVPSVIASASGPGEMAGSIGLGFAIPVNQARRIADELIRTGDVTMPAINATIDVRSTGGALIAEVMPGGAAEKAGLRRGDLIVKAGDRQIDSGVALIAAIRSQEIGETVKLVVADPRTRETRDVDVQLEASGE